MLQIQMLVSYLTDRLDRENGATMVEYGLLVALIAVIVAVAAKFLGQGVSTLFSNVEGSL